MQREELLARIANELDLNKARQERMKTAYKAVSELFHSDLAFFSKYEIDVYPQGSVRIGTSVKPINGEDFDLDMVLHIYDIYNHHTPKNIFDELVRVISGNDIYKPMMEIKKRCVRLNYKGDFHIDILPGCMPNYLERMVIKIPERALLDWSSGNPKGFAEWFQILSEKGKESVLRSFWRDSIKFKLNTEELPSDIYAKTPLQRTVQLFKRYRDIYFQNREYPVSSIIITAICGRLYEGEKSIYHSLNNVLSKIRFQYQTALKEGVRFKIFNPINPEEEFTDSWTAAHYLSFIEFVNDFYSKWERIKDQIDGNGEALIKLFGEGIYKEALRSQMLSFSHLSGDDSISAVGIILGNSAHTDRDGKINTHKGIRNEPHHNFGE